MSTLTYWPWLALANAEIRPHLVSIPLGRQTFCVVGFIVSHLQNGKAFLCSPFITYVILLNNDVNHQFLRDVFPSMFFILYYRSCSIFLYSAILLDSWCCLQFFYKIFSTWNIWFSLIQQVFYLTHENKIFNMTFLGCIRHMEYMIPMHLTKPHWPYPMYLVYCNALWWMPVFIGQVLGKCPFH